MGMATDLGTIEPGKIADLVVVDGNPLTEITDLRKTRYTIKDGVVYERDALLRRPVTSSSR
jgi:imidazolonepropionase-like amidohydrolase